MKHCKNHKFHYVAADDSFTFTHQRDENPHPQDFTLHYEKGYEIYMFIDGKGEFNIEGNKYNLEPYSILIINSNELHVLDISESSPYERMVLAITKNFLPPFMVNGVDFFRKIKNRKLGYGNQINAASIKNSGLLELFAKLQQLCENKSEENEFVAKCIIVQMLSTINNILQTDLPKIQKISNNKINEILEYINSNLNEPLTLDSLAEKFFLSKYHLCHIFKEATGYSINKYISFKRIHMADSLMLKGYSPTEACFMSGFNNYSNFYKSYRKITGNSPKNIKKSQL